MRRSDNDLFIGFNELKELLGITKVTLLRWERMGIFPKRINFIEKVTRWTREEVDIWLKETRPRLFLEKKIRAKNLIT